jgi:alpha-1,3-glucosyltransferase
MYSKSTDFEVHRNWLAITYELPLSRWYFESTSQWTLDYPPFFAYFEYLLSLPASLIDRDMLRVTNLDYSKQSVVFYQRATVIVSDLVYLYGCLRFVQAESKEGRGRFDLVRLSFIYASAAFLLLDNIHFQYNSMMYGLLILSYIKEGKYYKSAAVYAILLNFKHIYLYCAPVMGIIYLKQLVLSQQTLCRSILHLFLLALQTIGIFALSFGPFVYLGGVE